MKRWLISSGLLVLVAAGSLTWWLNREQARIDLLVSQWSNSSPQSSLIVDHQAWQDVLDNYLETDHDHGVNLFAYGDVDDEDQILLNDYLSALSRVDLERYNTAEQMAYWINLYNALTVRLVINNYPADSIRQMGQDKLSIGPWNDKVITIDEIELSLNDIEHRILRPIWQDPRIHFAVNCASIGCPNLQPEAFSGEALNDQLNRASSEFVNHQRGVSWVDQTLVLSSIFDWYGTDFAADEPGVLAALAQYADPTTGEALQQHQGEIEYQYDWALNDAEY